MLGDLYTKIQSWVTEPFSTPLDAVQIFLIVGLLMVAVIVWGRLLARIREAI